MRRKYKHGRVGVKRPLDQMERRQIRLRGYHAAWLRRAQMEREFLEGLFGMSNARSMKSAIRARLGAPK